MQTGVEGIDMATEYDSGAMSARARTVFIAGATGVLGRRLVRQLAGRGHRVIGLARSADKARQVREAGGEAAEADLFDADALARAADGADVVIHAATAIPTGRAATRPSAWALNDRIRTDGTLALATAAGLVGATRYLQQSVAWVVARSPGDAPFDESTPTSPPRLLASAVEGEAVAREVGRRHGFDVAVLRNGVLYAPDAAHTLELAGNLRRRRPTVLGRGKYLVAPIHADDAALAFALASEARGDGLWHIVDDEPVEAMRLHRHFAALLDAPPPRRVPLWLARLAAGKDAVAAVTTSMNTSNARAREELGWAPTHPTYREGLRVVVEAWAAAGD